MVFFFFFCKVHLWHIRPLKGPRKRKRLVKTLRARLETWRILLSTFAIYVLARKFHEFPPMSGNRGSTCPLGHESPSIEDMCLRRVKGGFPHSGKCGERNLTESSAGGILSCTKHVVTACLRMLRIPLCRGKGSDFQWAPLFCCLV